MPNAELYIYGGAFKGLPSIDPQCLALISYLSIVSHQEYTIVESNDPGISPTGTLQRSLPLNFSLARVTALSTGARILNSFFFLLWMNVE
jgi:hypothetical protein